MFRSKNVGATEYIPSNPFHRTSTTLPVCIQETWCPTHGVSRLRCQALGNIVERFILTQRAAATPANRGEKKTSNGNGMAAHSIRHHRLAQLSFADLFAHMKNVLSFSSDGASFV